MKSAFSRYGRLVVAVFIVCSIGRCLAEADLSQREVEEPLLVRKERQVGRYNYNAFTNIFASLLSWIYVIPSSNSVISNSSTLVFSDQFWLTFFQLIQYFTFFGWFVMLLMGYVGGVIILFIFQIAYQGPAGINGFSGARNGGMDGSVFRSFEDENMPLFEKVTSVGYGLLDRTSELYNLAQSPECIRYAMCHASSTLGDQEANGFVFKDLFRSISAQLDNKAGAEGMTRSVNVGLLTGECEEPIMSCPELAPYFKKVADTWSNYL